MFIKTLLGKFTRGGDEELRHRFDLAMVAARDRRFRSAEFSALQLDAGILAARGLAGPADSTVPRAVTRQVSEHFDSLMAHAKSCLSIAHARPDGDDDLDIEGVEVMQAIEGFEKQFDMEVRAFEAGALPAAAFMHGHQQRISTLIEHLQSAADLHHLSLSQRSPQALFSAVQADSYEPQADEGVQVVPQVEAEVLNHG